MLTSLLLVLAAPNGIVGYLKRNYTGDRAKIFHGLYRSNAFDTALLIPYFIVMVILAFYGITSRIRRMRRSGMSRRRCMARVSCRL